MRFRIFNPVVFFLMSVPGMSIAAENFYPIVGPNGSVQIIRGVQDSRAAPEEKKAISATPVSPDEASVVNKEQKASGQPAVTEAPYDSDVYVDSEALEQSGFNPAKKKRFYVTQDALGSHMTTDSEGKDADTGAFSEPVLAARAVTSFPLHEEKTVLSVAEAKAEWPVLGQCLSSEKLAATKPLEKGEAVSLVLDKPLYAFLDASGIVSGYKIEGEGLRTLLFSSYSKTDKTPAFARPLLAFFDRQGCPTRVLTRYYEKSYPATEKRHPMLEAELNIHGEEVYIFVLAAKKEESLISLASPYQLSYYGQLKLTFQK